VFLKKRCGGFFVSPVDSVGRLQDHLDDLRVKSTGSSAMSHAIDKCTRYLDAPMVEQLVPPLEELMKKGLGVATKAGCARLVGSLVSSSPDLLVSHAAKLVKTMVGSWLLRVVCFCLFLFF
jgi:proteasome component ECM29